MVAEYEPSSVDWVREQVERYERTGGREGATVDGRPVVILTTTGARSGAVRKSPVMRLESAGVYAAIGSVGGGPRHPSWYVNLLADPRCQLQDGPHRHDMIAHEAVGDERRRWWDAAVAGWSHFAEMQAKTERVFPVLVFEPVRSTPLSPGR